jgi:hypothetical protein
MSINFPTSLDSLSNPNSGDALNSPSHSTQHANANDAIEALEAKVGINSSAVTTSFDYKLGEVTSSDKAVGKTATQTLTNKTLTAPAINLGSDATGDMYYRNSGGSFTRLPIGSASQTIQVSSGGIPEWIANPAASDASTTVKGVVEIATTAEVTAGTGTGGTGAKLVVSPDALAASTPVFNGSGLTNVTPATATKLDCVYTDVTPAADTNENTIYTKSIAGGTLSTNNAVRLKIYFDTFTMTNNGTFTIRCKYGSTTVATLTVTAVNVTAAKGTLEFILMGSGSASTQEGTALLFCTPEGVGTTSVVVNYMTTGTAAETSSGALNLVVTTQSQFTGTLSGTLTLRTATLEKIF